jgi:hypothetical protein
LPDSHKPIDEVRDGRHLMDHPPVMYRDREMFGRYLAWHIQHGGHPFTPQGIADTVDAAAFDCAMAAIYMQRTGEEGV